MRPPTTIDTCRLRTDAAPQPDPLDPTRQHRTNRTAVCPHRASTPPQSGHLNTPPANIRSTRTGSGPTLSNDASGHE